VAVEAGVETVVAAAAAVAAAYSSRNGVHDELFDGLQFVLRKTAVAAETTASAGLLWRLRTVWADRLGCRIHEQPDIWAARLGRRILGRPWPESSELVLQKWRKPESVQ